MGMDDEADAFSFLLAMRASARSRAFSSAPSAPARISLGNAGLEVGRVKRSKMIRLPSFAELRREAAHPQANRWPGLLTVENFQANRWPGL